MARKKQGGLAEDFLALASRAPWWAELLMAGAALIALRALANLDVQLSGGSGYLYVIGLILLHGTRAIASMLQWVVPPLFLAAAGLSFYRQRKGQAPAASGVAVSVPAPEPSPPAEAAHDWDVEIRSAYDQRVEPSPAIAKPSAWSRDVLARMDWKRFEALTAAFYAHMGFRAETLARGPDGGVDVKVYRGDEPDPAAIVHCRAWTSAPVDVKPMRELLAVMANNKVETGVFLTTGTFTDEAIEFAGSHRIALGSGEQLLARLEALSDVARKQLLEVAVEGDWTTPTCPSCGTKMAQRQESGAPFWGCISVPPCPHAFEMKPE